MAYYVPKYNGYIADVADMDFIRSDGLNFSFKEATATSVSQSADNITINGGWSIYPLAYIDTGRTLELTFTSAQFSMEMFELANNTTSSTQDYGIYESDVFTVNASKKIEIPYEVQPSTVKIRGLAYTASTPAAGEFAVTYTPPTYNSATPPVMQTAGKTEITFYSTDVAENDTIRVTYKRRIKSANVLSVNTDTITARGSMYLHWPVYSSGDDLDKSTIKGYVHVSIPAVRVTALPGFDTSYKSAATNAISVATIDAKRSDKKAYDLVYEELTNTGAINVDYGASAWTGWNT